MADPNLVQQESFSQDFVTQPVAGSANYELKLPCNIAVASNAVLQLVLVGPDHSRKEVVPTASTDGTYVYYVTDGSEFPLPGNYTAELEIQATAGPPPTWTKAQTFQIAVAPAA